ncbi:hypothetical protein H2248_001791 [Termitomyces sp. 'cryptogamus']|nr:hypothetical protein H2248_001791 [Termitomyces sp. 'cryptogamus']
MPSGSHCGDRGARILFDPVFGNRCSPSQWINPKRYRQPPCKIEETPEVNSDIDQFPLNTSTSTLFSSSVSITTMTSVCCLSLIDLFLLQLLLPVLTRIRSESSPNVLTFHISSPHLEMAFTSQSFNIPDNHVHIMDWWDTKCVEVSVSIMEDKATHKVTSTSLARRRGISPGGPSGIASRLFGQAE